MRDVLNQWLGAQGGQVIQMIGALLVVVVLIVVFAWVMRRFGAGSRQQPARRGERPTQRLAVVDAAHVDGQRRLVLVRRDDVEHLVMIGGPNDVLIEPRIVRGQPLGGQRPAPQAAHYPTVAVPTSSNGQQPQQQPARATTQQQATASGQPSVSMPPPFVESVTSPATPNRNHPIATDLRAAMGDGRRTDDLVDTQRDGYPTRQHTAPPQPAPQSAQATRPPQNQPQNQPQHQPQYQPQYQPQQHQAYDEPTVAAARPTYAAAQTPAGAGRTATSPSPRPSAPQALSLEDMVAAGLEQAISRPDPAPTRPVTRSSGSAFGQRVDPSTYDSRTPAKDAVAAEIEKAIYGLTSPGTAGGRMATGRSAQPDAQRGDVHRPVNYQAASRREPEPMAREPARLEAPRQQPEPSNTTGRLPHATQPVFARSQPPQVRPTLVAQHEPVAEPVVAVLPQPDTVRGDARSDGGRRSSSEIEDEMARLLSELTGTTGR